MSHGGTGGTDRVGQAAVQRALVCLRYGIGDVVMELPALRHLRAQWPQTHLTALGAHPATELLEGDSVVDALVRVQDLGFDHWGDPGTPEARERAAGWVAASGFARVLDASHAPSGMRQVLHAAGIPILDTGGPVIPQTSDPDGGGAAVRSILASAVHAWGLEPASHDPRPVLHIGADAREAIRAFLHRRGLEGQECIAIAPVASSGLKRWPLPRVFRLIRHLCGARASRILVLGLRAGEPTAERLRRAAPDRVEIVPPVHLQQTAALIERCDALVCNDTGLMHMGAAVGTGTIAVFGPSAPSVLLPPGAIAVSTDTSCGYRHLDRLGPPQCVLDDQCLIAERGCIRRIGVDAVAARVHALLERVGTEPVPSYSGGSP